MSKAAGGVVPSAAFVFCGRIAVRPYDDVLTPVTNTQPS